MPWVPLKHTGAPPPNNMCPYPTNRDDAVKRRKARYWNDTPDGHCKKCLPYVDAPFHIRYTKSDHCAMCARIDAFDLWRIATGGARILRMGDQWFVAGSGFSPINGMRGYQYRPVDNATVTKYTEALELLGVFDCAEEIEDEIIASRPAARSQAECAELGLPRFVSHSECAKDGHIHIREAETGDCYYCVNRISPRQAAIAAGEKWYTPDRPCIRCGTKAPRRVADGFCKGCAAGSSDGGLSPRQAAIAAGEKWYTPSTPCKRCGTLSLRHVDNGRCRGCGPAQRSTGPSIMEQCPDLVISRSDARTAGLTVYRTGRECRYGHRGWRYVSTGGCVDCLRG